LLLFCGTASADITTFVSPDNSYLQLESFIQSADSSLYINAYTFDSPYIAAKLLDAQKRGVDVIVMVDASPVGGISKSEWSVLNNLSGSGIPVYLWDDADLGFNHAKYAVSDNSTVLVATENFGSTGFPIPPTTGNRGWGAVISGQPSADFTGLFFDDLVNAKRLDFEGHSPLDFYSEEKEYEMQFEPVTYPGNFKVAQVVAPENAVESILDLINSADSSLYIEQFYVYRYWGQKKKGYTDNPFLEAAIDAARRGAEVKLLLDSTWYNVEEDDPTSNKNTADYVNAVAREEGLNLEARLVDLGASGFSKIHAKGAIADNDTVLISSVNWNEHSPTKNREVGVIIYGEPAGYFAEVFMADWGEEKVQKDGHDSTLLLIPLGIGAVSLYLKRRKQQV
jgi:phosphatidylserine/phosphatidylglycerophosphate/cardiolipin synthase-like enzyme